MTIPLIILAVGTASVGLIFSPMMPWGSFDYHLEKTFGFERLGHFTHPHAHDLSIPVVGTPLAGVLGLALSGVMYANPSPIPARLAHRLRTLYEASYNKFWVDEFYLYTVVNPLRGLARLRLPPRRPAGAQRLVKATARIPRLFGRELLAPLQNGLIQFYAAITALGVAGLLPGSSS